MGRAGLDAANEVAVAGVDDVDAIAPLRPHAQDQPIGLDFAGNDLGAGGKGDGVFECGCVGCAFGVEAGESPHHQKAEGDDDERAQKNDDSLQAAIACGVFHIFFRSHGGGRQFRQGHFLR